ncbi:MAG: formylglycine-generating enzyme family protein, partial [Magnetospirillum sp.]
MMRLRTAATTGVLALTLTGISGFAAAGPAPGQSFRPCDQCPEMVAIPTGTVTAGNPKDFENAEADAPKRPTITIKRSYALGKYEVTQAEWTAIMGDNPSENKGVKNPVEHVDWKMTQEFIRRLNLKTGQTFRLPTEAEWEYAARAGNSASYSFGEDEKQLAEYAWFVDNSGKVTHPVGQLKPNAYGLFDMHGNVWEWTG